MLRTLSSTVGAFQQAAPTKPPVLTAGDITPKASWEIGCITYFAHKDTSPAYQVQHVAWGLQDARIQQWYAIKHDRLNTLIFAAFMTELRLTWLPTNWAADTHMKMLSSRQTTQPFHEWATKFQTQNALLVSLNSHLSTEKVQYHLEAHMNFNLTNEYRNCRSPHLCAWY